MDPQLQAKFQELETKVDAIWHSVEKTRKYFQITLWVTVIFFVLPLLIALFAIPQAMNSYLGSLDVNQFEELQGL